MRLICVVGAILLAIGLTTNADAGDTRVYWVDGVIKPCRVPPRSCPAHCPDNYTCKPMPPCPSLVNGCVPDDYGRKPLPCTEPVLCGCPSVYCPPPYPSIVIQCCYPPWYICGAGQGPTTPGKGTCPTPSLKPGP
jgi:hypothetical protein